MPAVKFLVFVLIASGLVGMAGCMGTPSCNPAPGPAKHEPFSPDFEFCGTAIRWNGVEDRVEVVRVGERIAHWEQWVLNLPTPPNPGRASVGISFNEKATLSSPVIVETVGYRMKDYATGPMVPGDFVSFCRRTPSNSEEVHIGMHADVGGDIVLNTMLQACR